MIKENIARIAVIVIGVLLSAGVIWGVATLVSTTTKANEGQAAYNFIQQTIAAQKQAATQPASAAK